MDILKAANDWAKAELFSTPFFILFGALFVLASFGFWQLGKTEIAKAYFIPLLVTGVLLMIIGIGLFFNNKSRLANFPSAYANDKSAFVASELSRAEATLKEYRNVVFTAIPIILVICALGIMFLKTPIWRASLISVIAMLVVILLVDGTAYGRMDIYHQQLLSVEKEE